MVDATQIEARLARLEERMDRMMGLLERAIAPGIKANGVSHAAEDAVTGAAHSAELALVGAHGDGAVRERVGELLMRLGEPETLESLTRIVVLLPDLEYALQGVAAGPELLEEGLELVRSRLGEAASSHEAQRRLDAILAAATALSQPDVVRTLTALATRVGHLEPAITGAARAVGDLAQAQGAESVRARVTEAVLTLADEEVLGSLTRIANLAPDLEYAVQALAAGPALLEEGLDLARTRLARAGVEMSELDARLESASSILLAVTSREVSSGLGELTCLLPSLMVPLRAAGQAAHARIRAEGADALSTRLAETLVRLSDPEVLESLTRVATLLPDVEYAVQALAAGPELLEEGLELVRTWSKRNGGEVDLDQRLQAVASILVKATDRPTLAALQSTLEHAPVLMGALTQALELSKRVDVAGLMHLAEAVAQPEARRGLEQLVGILPNVGLALAVLPTQPETLRFLASINTAVSDSMKLRSEVGMFGLLGALREPEVRRAAGFGIEIARRVGRQLDSQALVRS